MKRSHLNSSHFIPSLSLWGRWATTQLLLERDSRGPRYTTSKRQKTERHVGHRHFPWFHISGLLGSCWDRNHLPRLVLLMILFWLDLSIPLVEIGKGTIPNTKKDDRNSQCSGYYGWSHVVLLGKRLQSKFFENRLRLALTCTRHIGLFLNVIVEVMISWSKQPRRSKPATEISWRGEVIFARRVFSATTDFKNSRNWLLNGCWIIMAFAFLISRSSFDFRRLKSAP